MLKVTGAKVLAGGILNDPYLRAHRLQEIQTRAPIHVGAGLRQGRTSVLSRGQRPDHGFVRIPACGQNHENGGVEVKGSEFLFFYKAAVSRGGFFDQTRSGFIGPLEERSFGNGLVFLDRPLPDPRHLSVHDDNRSEDAVVGNDLVVIFMGERRAPVFVADDEFVEGGQ